MRGPRDDFVAISGLRKPGLGQGHNQKKDTHTLDFDVTLRSDVICLNISRRWFKMSPNAGPSGLAIFAGFSTSLLIDLQTGLDLSH
jgi:hypothetical protein